MPLIGFWREGRWLGIHNADLWTGVREQGVGILNDRANSGRWALAGEGRALIGHN